MTETALKGFLAKREEWTSKVSFVGQNTLTKQNSIQSYQKHFKRKSVFLFFGSHLPPGLRSMGDFAFLFTGSIHCPFNRLCEGGVVRYPYIPWRKSALRLVSLLSCRLAILEMPLWLKCSTSRLPISGSRLPVCPVSLEQSQENDSLQPLWLNEHLCLPHTASFSWSDLTGANNLKAISQGKGL